MVTTSQSLNRKQKQNTDIKRKAVMSLVFGA